MAVNTRPSAVRYRRSPCTVCGPMTLLLVSFHEAEQLIWRRGPCTLLRQGSGGQDLRRMEPARDVSRGPDVDRYRRSGRARARLRMRMLEDEEAEDGEAGSGSGGAM